MKTSKTTLEILIEALGLTTNEEARNVIIQAIVAETSK